MSDINVQSFSGKVKVSNDLTVTTNVHADYFKGDGSLLTNLPSGSGGVWNTNSDNEIYFISSNVGISNADPGHNLSVGSNLYVDDDGSNVLVVTGNVKADHFVGDGSLLTGLSGSGGVWSTNAANEIYFINNNVGISNADPGHNLSVGSNLYVDDDGLDVLVVTGNVNATYLKGNGSMITNLPSGSGGVWSTNADNEIYFISSNVGISNSNPGHNLSVGSNLYVDDDGSNVLVVDGNIAAESIVIGGISIVPSYPLSLVTETGNITPHTIQFTNATTGLVVSSNIVVTGNVTAAYLHGDASNVTAVPAAQITGTLDAARIPTLNQSTTGSAATLTTPRSIGGVDFDGSVAIVLPGVNSGGTQNTSGSAATLTTARTIGGVSFDGSAAIVPTTFGAATFSGDVTVASSKFSFDTNGTSKQENLGGNGRYIKLMKYFGAASNWKIATGSYSTNAYQWINMRVKMARLDSDVKTIQFNFLGTGGIYSVREPMIIGTSANNEVKVYVNTSTLTYEIYIQTNSASSVEVEISHRASTIDDDYSTVAAGAVSETGLTKIYDSSTTTDFIVKSGNVGIGTTSPDERLHVVGNIKHEGLTMTSGTDVDQMITIPISLSFDGSTWYTITSGSSHLTTGTWIVKVYIHSASGAGSGQLYDETYSGMFTWYSGGTNSTVVNDIALHNAGHAQNAEVISMRTRRTGSGGVNLILEINSNISWGGTVRTTSFFCRRLL